MWLFYISLFLYHRHTSSSLGSLATLSTNGGGERFFNVSDSDYPEPFDYAQDRGTCLPAEALREGREGSALTVEEELRKMQDPDRPARRA